MNFKRISVVWAFIVTFTFGLSPPQNVNIIIKDNNVSFTWTLSFDPGRFTHLNVKNGAGIKVVENYTRVPGTSFTTTVLSQCQQYTVSLRSITSITWSDPVNIQFWMTELNPPKNVEIIMKDKHVHFSWTLPSESVTATYLDVYNGSGIGTQKLMSDIVPFPGTAHILSNLLQCHQYTVKLQSGNHSVRSEAVEKTFWTPDKIYTTDISTDVNLTWTTGLDDFYQVKAPSVTIYSVIGGSINPHSDWNHYNIYSVGHYIHIGVINVTQNDGGLYKSESSTDGVDGCCLLIVTDKPTKPQLTYDKHPFVGYPTVLTCKSEIQRWPAAPAASLKYTFPAIGQQENNNLAINSTKSDKGKRIYCMATDDVGKTSESSDVITLDPYYGPEHVSISPPDKVVNVTEGDNLPSVTCSADCNPDCEYVWRNSTKKFTDGNILKIDKVGRIHNGTYRCRVRHPNDTIRGVYPDGNNRRAEIYVNINVLYPPTISNLQFSNIPNIYFQYYSTNYEFNEDNQVFIRIHVDSNPEPHLYFYSTSFSKNELKYNISSSYYTALLPPLNCEDSGQYTIEANNGIKNSTNTNVQLIIQCKPKYIVPERPKIGTQIGASENVVINVVAYPKPTVKWLNGTGTRSAWRVEQNGANYKYKLTSVVQITEEPQFGQYGVQIYNRFGSTSINIAVAPRDKPQPPTHVFVDVFADKANISWFAGFDGGLDQSFSIKFKKQNENEQSYKTIRLNGTGIKTDTALSHLVTGLAPSTPYIISVIAENSYGSRDNSTEFTTFAAPVPVDKSGVSIVAIVCGLVGGLLVLIIVVLGFIYYRCRISNNVAVQENRTDTENDRYIALARTDMQADCHNGDYSELNVAASASNRVSGNNKGDDYMEITDKTCDTGRKYETNKDVYMEITDAEYVNAITSDSSNAEVGETDFYENQ